MRPHLALDEASQAKVKAQDKFGTGSGVDTGPKDETRDEGEGQVKIWFDTEFIEDGKTIDLLSIGMVRDDGATLYLENLSADVSRANKWVEENVIYHLDYVKHGVAREEMGPKIRAFAGEKPEFWAYYADYDWVALCQLYGTMMDLPKGWPMYCRDVKQLCDDVGNPKLPEQRSTEHHALADALWTRHAWDFLQKMKGKAK